MAMEMALAEIFIPKPDVSKVHEIVIDAPAEVVLDVAEHFDLASVPGIRFLFKLRELLFRARPKPRPVMKSLVSETASLGWVRLAHNPGRELVMGAVAQPWMADVEFRSVPPSKFADFNEPGFVKIVWTLETEPRGHRVTLFRTQTRVLATDAAARGKFLLYWLFAGKLVSLIRMLAIRAIKRESERRLV